MEIGINDLDFNEDDFGISQPQPSSNQQLPLDGDGEEIKPWLDGNLEGNPPIEPPSNVQTPTNTPEEEDIITLLLREKNIGDPTKIKFEDEEGNIQERDWNTLTKEEQLNILKTPSENEDTSLDDAEIGLINQLRLNQMTPEEFIAVVKQQGAAEYAQSLELGQATQIDDLTDEDLFILDLQSRVEDITDEEAQQALDRAKQDSNLFSKQMKGIREEYKRIEEERVKMNELEQQQKDSEQFEEFKNAVLDSIQSLDKISSLDITMDDDDMNEIANFILSTDSAGVNYLAKALDDPQTLVRMAWFALKGEEAIDSITEYFTEEIKKVSQAKYEQGLKDGKAGKKTSTKTSTVVVQTPEEKPKQTPFIGGQQKQQFSIDDLD